MKVTDSHWRKAMVYRGPLIGHVDVVWILYSTWPINSGPDWLKYILSMAFSLVLAGGGSRGGWGLEKDTTDEHLQKTEGPDVKLTQVCSGLLCGWRGR
jgi:hypothetical protein